MPPDECNQTNLLDNGESGKLYFETWDATVELARTKGGILSWPWTIAVLKVQVKPEE